MRVALDAFGGDDCPDREVAAAVAAARLGTNVVLVGDGHRLERALEEHAHADGPASGPGTWRSLPLEIHHASDAIAMDDAPARAVRQKPDASMPVAFDLLRRGEVDALVSAGNTGAMLACGLLKLGRVSGVDRPALVTTFPTRRGQCCMLDMGANVDCRPLHLVQFAVMGSVYAATRQGKVRPRVALLANGHEPSKGNAVTRAAHELLRQAADDGGLTVAEYLGYREGKDVFRGEVDVVVVDGFVGNVALKFLEGAMTMVSHYLRGQVEASVLSKLGALLARPVLAAVADRIDPDSYGGAPLLGVKGVAVTCHGGSSVQALTNGVRQAENFHDAGLTEALTQAFARHRPLFEAAKASSIAPTRG